MKYVNEHGQAVLERASQDVYDVIASQQGDWTVDSVEYSKNVLARHLLPGICSWLFAHTWHLWLLHFISPFPMARSICLTLLSSVIIFFLQAANFC